MNEWEREREGGREEGGTAPISCYHDPPGRQIFSLQIRIRTDIKNVLSTLKLEVWSSLSHIVKKKTKKNLVGRLDYWVLECCRFHIFIFSVLYAFFCLSFFFWKFKKNIVWDLIILLCWVSLQLNQKYDPEDKHHIVRIYDYFVYQRHLCICFELLDTNL